jgi:hypothetical protein
MKCDAIKTRVLNHREDFESRSQETTAHRRLRLMARHSAISEDGSRMPGQGRSSYWAAAGIAAAMRMSAVRNSLNPSDPFV